MNRRGRLARVATALAMPRWPPDSIDVETATEDELFAIMATDAELGELVRQCFAEHPDGTLFGRTWPDPKRPGQRCGLSAYLFGHPKLGRRAEAVVERMAADATVDAQQ